MLAFATAYDDDSYQLAAHASELWLDPMGGVLVTGPGGANLYMKGLLDKLGVTANVYKAGTYKAAVEPFTRNDMSPEAREALSAVYGSMWESWQQEVRQARPKAQLAPYIADTPGRIAAAGGDMARAALQAGPGRQDRRAARRSTAGSPRSPARATTPSREASAGSTTGPGSRPIRRATMAARSESSPSPATSSTARPTSAPPARRRSSRRSRRASGSATSRRWCSGSIRGGGSALASERIRQAVLAAKAQGPAGGGVDGQRRRLGRLLGGDGGRQDLRRALDDHRLDRRVRDPAQLRGHDGQARPRRRRGEDDSAVGRAGPAARPLAGGRPAAADGRRRHLPALPRLWSRRRARCRSAEVDQIAQGRIWDGGTARQLGLVDAFGGLDDAIREAARLAKLDPEEAEAVWLEKEPDFGDRLLMSLAGDGEEERPRPTRSAASPPSRG